MAPIGWAHGSLYSAHKARLPARPLMATGLQMLFGSAALSVEAAPDRRAGTLRPGGRLGRVALGVVYLTSSAAWSPSTPMPGCSGTRRCSLVGTYAYVNPVVAVALGAIVLSEPITPRTLIASAVIVGAVAMIVTARGRAGRAEADAEPGAAGSPAAARPAGHRPPAARRAAAISRAPVPRPGPSG